MSSHGMFWVVGMIVGAATAGMIGKSFVEERGRRLIPLFVALAVVFGLVIGWSLNAWVNYMDYTANGGGAAGL